MTPEKYVKQFYPDAFCEYSRGKKFAVAANIEGEQVIIGESEFFERIAWQNAKDWLDSLPADSYNDSLPQHPGTPAWVKCSDRLPGHKRRVKWRDGNNTAYVTDGEISLFEMDKPYLDGWEWYDETGQSNRDDAVVEIERRNKLLENNLKLGMRLNRPGISEQDQEDTWRDYKRRNNL